MMVSESLVRALWPGEDAIGKTLDGRTIIGVVGNARQTALQDPDAVEGYLPMEPAVWNAATVVVKTATTPENWILPIAELARTIDPDVFTEVEMLKTAFARKQDNAELTAVGVSLLGVSALLLAAPAFAHDADGEWEGMIDTPMGAIPVGFTFKTDGAALSGTLITAPSLPPCVEFSRECTASRVPRTTRPATPVTRRRA